MKKLSVSLKESRFVDMINKKFTGERRKEEIGNLNELKPVDIGTSVLWADNGLCVGGEYLFTFDEITNILKGSKWRLPTVSEVNELKKCKKDVKDGKYIFTKNDTSLTFYPNGYIYVSPTTKKTAHGTDLVMGWTSDVSEYDDNYISIYSIIILSMTDWEISFGKENFIDKDFLLSARLVKDK